MSIKVGETVRFKDPIHAKYWFLKQETGVVAEIGKSYRDLSEILLYVDFGDKRVYAAERMFEVVTKRTP